MSSEVLGRLHMAGALRRDEFDVETYECDNHFSRNLRPMHLSVTDTGCPYRTTQAQASYMDYKQKKIIPCWRSRISFEISCVLQTSRVL